MIPEAIQAGMGFIYQKFTAVRESKFWFYWSCWKVHAISLLKNGIQWWWYS